MRTLCLGRAHNAVSQCALAMSRAVSKGALAVSCAAAVLPYTRARCCRVTALTRVLLRRIIGHWAPYHSVVSGAAALCLDTTAALPPRYKNCITTHPSGQAERARAAARPCAQAGCVDRAAGRITVPRRRVAALLLPALARLLSRISCLRPCLSRYKTLYRDQDLEMGSSPLSYLFSTFFFNSFFFLSVPPT